LLMTNLLTDFSQTRSRGGAASDIHTVDYILRMASFGIFCTGIPFFLLDFIFYISTTSPSPPAPSVQTVVYCNCWGRWFCGGYFLIWHGRRVKLLLAIDPVYSVSKQYL
jgi:hypothetical protein